MMNKGAAVWTVRLLLAVLFIFGGEILLWTSIQQYTAVDWLIRLIGYPVLAVLILDLAARYRIRDIYDAMVLFALYGLLVGLLITPTVSLVNFPYSILTRVLGGHTLLGFEMWGFLLVLTAGNKRRYQLLLVGIAAWLGFYWGIWLRWIPEFGMLFEAVSIESALMIAGIFFAMIVILAGFAFRVRHDLKPLDFRLPNAQWILFFLVFVGLYAYQSISHHVTVWMLLVVAFLLVVCWAILWYRREDEGATLLDSHFPVQIPLSLFWMIFSAGIFSAMAILSFQLPLVGTGEYNQLWLMEMGFGTVGTLWLPLVASVLAIRGVDYQMRTGQLR